MDSDGLNRWFDGYLDVFAACGRGETEVDALLAYYAVPLLVTTDDGFFALTGGEQVVEVMRRQVDGMRAAGYAGTRALDTELTVLNATSALYRGTYAWQREDGSEIRRVTLTYLITDGEAGRRISVLAVHTP